MKQMELIVVAMKTTQAYFACVKPYFFFLFLFYLDMYY